jgi:uncharacterized membrane protein
MVFGRPGVKRLAGRLACLTALLSASLGVVPAHADESVVRAVIFYAPTCPHCHQVATVDLPPLQDRYGERFTLAWFDVTEPLGEQMYEAAIAAFGIPEDRIGVPTLIIGTEVLVGSGEIPARLPALVEAALAGAGTDWPAIPGLREVLGVAPPVASGEPPPMASGEPPPVASGEPPNPGNDADVSLDAISARFARDPACNAMAVGVLVALLVALAWTGASMLSARRPGSAAGRPSRWIGPVALVGLLVAAYMAGVEVSGASAVCGPLGDCNAVHSSIYARVFGIPVGLLGLVGYVAVLSCWGIGRWSAGHATAARVALVVLAFVGTAFSAYLTLLEPFVIGATCAWCLASALSMAVILLLAAGTQPRTGHGGRVTR